MKTAGERRRRRWRDVFRDFFVAASIAAALVAILDVEQTQRDVDEGRRLAQRVTCATLGAVIEQGRSTIEGGAYITPREFERALVGLGLPPLEARIERANVAAQGYAEGIAFVVERESGVRGIVRRDGTLDCDRLRKLTLQR